MKNKKEIEIKIRRLHERFDKISDSINVALDQYSYDLLVRKLTQIEDSREALEWVLADPEEDKEYNNRDS